MNVQQDDPNSGLADGQKLKKCMDTCMSEPMSQNSYFGYREGPQKV